MAEEKKVRTIEQAGTSLAVRQFVAALRGEVRPHAPVSLGVRLVVEFFGRCPVCGSEQGQDVVVLDGGRLEVCRCCLSERMVEG